MSCSCSRSLIELSCVSNGAGEESGEESRVESGMGNGEGHAKPVSVTVEVVKEAGNPVCVTGDGEEESSRPVSTKEGDDEGKLWLGSLLVLPGLLPPFVVTTSPPNLILSFCLGFLTSPGDCEGPAGPWPGG